jgi:hypothetical protein
MAAAAEITAVSCRCGEVEFDVLGARPAAVILDGCRDCRDFNDWALGHHMTAVGGAPLPRATAPLHQHYYPNRVRVRAGEENLFECRLDRQTATVRVVAKCCWSQLMGDHPLYGRGFFVVQAETCRPNGAAGGLEVYAPAAWGLQENAVEDGRVFVSSLGNQELEQLTPWTGKEGSCVTGKESADVQLQLLVALCDEIRQTTGAVDLPPAGSRERPRWTTLQELVEQLKLVNGYPLYAKDSQEVQALD